MSNEATDFKDVPEDLAGFNEFPEDVAGCSKMFPKSFAGLLMSFKRIWLDVQEFSEVLGLMFKDVPNVLT